MAKRLCWLMLILILPVQTYAGEAWVEWQAEKLSAEFTDVALAEALALTSAETGLEFSFNGAVDDGRIDLRFEEQSVEAAVRLMLAGYNFMLVYSGTQQAPAGKQVQRVLVLGKVPERASLATNTGIVQSPLNDRLAHDDALPISVELQRSDSGPYLGDGSINGKPVQFLVDTGATTVALSGALAKRLGLVLGTAKSITTAGGRTTGYETLLGSLALGGLQMSDVRAIVLPEMALKDRVLLGMNVLGAFDLVQQDNTLIIQSR